jgi:hypothetical protein
MCVLLVASIAHLHRRDAVGSIPILNAQWPSSDFGQCPCPIASPRSALAGELPQPVIPLVRVQSNLAFQAARDMVLASSQTLKDAQISSSRAAVSEACDRTMLSWPSYPLDRQGPCCFFTLASCSMFLQDGSSSRGTTRTQGTIHEHGRGPKAAGTIMGHPPTHPVTTPSWRPAQ